MFRSPFEVNIIGAGLGGVCLAQRLKKSGIRATIYERHNDRTYLAEGFWIEINDEGIAALRECLDPQHFKMLMASTQPTNRPDCRWLPRAALQRSLLDGLNGRVQFDKTFARYEQRTDRRVATVFSDGASVLSDILIAADGVHSKVRQQMLPHARRIDTGVLAIGGSASLSSEIMNVLPPRAVEYPIAINGPDHRQMFIAVWRGQPQLKASATEINDNEVTNTVDGKVMSYRVADQIMWRFAALSSEYNLQQDPEDVAGAELKATVLRMITSWSPPLRRLVELIDPATIFPLPIRSCVPVDPWTSGSVTLIGDAIHGMAPYGGFGANTAMRDAAVLGGKLASANHREKTLSQAVSEYEADMIGYGFDAVRRSMEILQQANPMNPMPLS
jgi:2-polyprenyl-6-methoxyphenol hydroxylase-like FAD-dependent oxidoreductase